MLLASLIIFSFAVVNILSMQAHGTEITVTDGLWWKSLSGSERQIALFAVMDGFGVAYQRGRIDGIVAAGRPIGETVGSIMHPTQTQTERIRRHLYPRVMELLRDQKLSPRFAGTDVSVYAKRVNLFYEKYPMAIRATLGTVLQCAMNKPLLSCDQVAKEAAHQGSD